MSNALELFKVAASLVLDRTGFDSDVQEADRSGKTLADNLSSYMEKAKKVIGGLFAAATLKKVAGEVWNLAKETSAAGDRIDKQSQQLGMSRKAFQEWDYILSQSGASIDSMTMSMRTMENAIAKNSPEVASGLAKIGLSAAKLQSMSPEEQFEAIVRGLQKMPEGAEKAMLATTLLGRNAAQLMPLLNSSADSVDELRQRAHDLGLIMSDEDVDASVHFGDALDDLNRTWAALKMKFGGQMLPTFTKGLIAAANALGRISNAISNAFKTGDWKGVFQTITDEIKNLVPGLVSTVVDIATGLFENADKIIDLAVSIVEGLADGIMKSMPILVRKLPQIAQSLLRGVINIAKSIGNGIIDSINMILGTNIPHLDEIKWPSWDDIKTAASNAWRVIKDGLKKIFIFAFGENEDGGVKWPTGEDVRGKLESVWKDIKKKLRDIFVFAFGENKDGGIKWPEWGDISAKVSEWWYGNGEDGGISGKLKDALTWVLNLFGLPKETTDEISRFVGGWWDTIVEGIQTACSWVLSLFGFAKDEDVKKHFKKWWGGEDGNGGIKGIIKTLANWTLGALGLPSVDEISSAVSKRFNDAMRTVTLATTATVNWINNAWDDIKNAFTSLGTWVGDGIRNVTVNFFAGLGRTFNIIWKWLTGEKGEGVPSDNSVQISFAGKLSKFVSTMLGWITGKKYDNAENTGNKEAKVNFVGTLGKLVSTMLGWITGKTYENQEDIGKKEAKVNFLGGLASGDTWISRMFDWFTKGIDIAVRFFKDPVGSMTNEEGILQGGEPSGLGWGESLEVPAVPGWGGFAKGLNYVPFDGYALIHRGETILNQNQGRQWRNGGGSGGINYQELYRTVASACAAAVAQIGVDMDGKRVGHAVSKYVSQDILDSTFGLRVTG